MDLTHYGDATISFLIEQEEKRQARYKWAFNPELLHALIREQIRRRLAAMSPEELRAHEEFQDQDGLMSPEELREYQERFEK